MEKNKIYVIGLDMEERLVKDIAKDAAMQIVAITNELIKKQEQEKEKNDSNIV